MMEYELLTWCEQLMTIKGSNYRKLSVLQAKKDFFCYILEKSYRISQRMNDYNSNFCRLQTSRMFISAWGGEVKYTPLHNCLFLGWQLFMPLF